ncbi:hypothetical protein [Palleronia caenipelagi]|uniref:Arylsulfatase n=1 Tax=Palleronia caenipelagi TaxID=2489174 RepID=A0A547PN11_9RHOB|nr:hypothetical protein [Palleronia caenipelagi]TRD15521.1 hypothetical protein FEV53_15965 [Palleronia caenipelagi]
MHIAFLHTADVHVATFDQIFDGLGRDAQLTHHVDASLLERARRDGIDAVRVDVETLLSDLSAADVVLCTCSTLGPLADDAAKSSSAIIMIDRPLMEQACADGDKVLVALCLDSARDATLNPLRNCAKEAGRNITPVVVICGDAWAFFEAENIEAYATTIASSIKAKIKEESGIKSIVLAQASMHVAEAKLADIGIPVRSSPVIAAKRCLEVGQVNKGETT